MDLLPGNFHEEPATARGLPLVDRFLERDRALWRFHAGQEGTARRWA
jgi:hypothetical protein